MRRDALGIGTTVEKQVRRPRVPARPLERGQRLVNGSPEKRVGELERRVRAEHVDTGEVGRCGRCFLVAQLGELRCVVRVDVVAEDRDRLG